MHNSARKHLKDAEELNITAFMNLMVILVPFLLITAVFSRMTILELNLPGLHSKQSQDKKVKLSLELVLKNNGFDVQDANLGLIKHFDRTPGETHWDQFSNIMVAIKRRFPTAHAITLLVEPDVDYKTLISTMDHVRSADIIQGTSVTRVELFPDISIGNAESASASNNANSQTSSSVSK